MPAPAAIDFYCTVDKAKGKHGEDRVVITFNGGQRQRHSPLLHRAGQLGVQRPSPATLLPSCRLLMHCLWPRNRAGKFLPHVEQRAEDNTAARP